MTNEKKSTRNEGRTTEVKFMFWNPEEGGTPYERTEKISYTRSEEIARKTLSEMFPNCMIQVTNLAQEEIKRIVYNPQLVFENMTRDFEDEEIAKNAATENQTVIPYIMCEYSGQFWAVNSDGEYITDYVMDNSPVKFTRVNMRQFLAMSAENLEGSDWTILAIHGEKRDEVTRYALIENGLLEKCVKES